MTDQHDDESRAPEGEPTTPTDPTASTEPTVSAEPEGTELAPGEQPPSDVTPTDSSEVTAVEPLPAPDHGTAVMCAECGENPARAAITIRHVTSYGLRFRRVERTAALCDACGHRALDEASASTLVKGLWGPRAAGAAWGAVSNNNQQRRFLEPVPAKQDGQQVRRPVFSRPAVWGALLVWVVVVVAFVGLVVARFLPSNNSLKTASDTSARAGRVHSSRRTCRARTPMPPTRSSRSWPRRPTATRCPASMATTSISRNSRRRVA